MKHYGNICKLNGTEVEPVDELWIAGGWRESKGCCMEYGFAMAKGIPVKFINN